MATQPGMLNGGQLLFSPSAAASVANRPLVSPASGGLMTFGNRRPTFTAQSDNYAAAVGDLVLMTTAGTSKTVTLPNSGLVAGDVVSVLYKNQTAGDTVTIAPNSKDIQGVAAASVDLKLFIADDTLGLHDLIELMYDGTEWWITRDGRVLHRSQNNLTTSETTNSAGVWTKVGATAGVWTNQFNVGGMWEGTTNKRFDIKRDGHYLISIAARPLNAVADLKYYGIRALISGTAEACALLMRQSISTSSGVMGTARSALVALTAGQYVEIQFIAEEANMGVAVTESVNTQDGVTSCSIVEVGKNY